MNTIKNFCILEPSVPVRQESYGIHSTPNPPVIKEEPVEMKEEEEEEEEAEDDEEDEAPSN